MKETKFKVGDKVYHPTLGTKIFILEPLTMNGDYGMSDSFVAEQDTQTEWCYLADMCKLVEINNV